MRPAREAYVRVSYMRAGFEVHPGVELCDGDSVDAMMDLLGAFAEAAHRTQGPHHVHVTQHMEALIAKEWPERAYFIETESARGGVQVYQPFGMPRNR